MVDEMSIQDMCAVIDDGKRVVADQARRIAYLERELNAAREAYSRTFDMYREARDGLWALTQPQANSEVLRDAAGRIDCGNMCEFGHSEHDTGAFVCGKEGSDEECANYIAQQLRELADGYDVLAKERQATPPASD